MRGFDGTPGMPGENARPAPKGEKGKIQNVYKFMFHKHSYRKRCKFIKKCLGFSSVDCVFIISEIF